MKFLQAQIDNIREGPAPAPGDAPRGVHPAMTEKKDKLRGMMQEIKAEALQEIENVIDQLPEKASDEDRKLVRDKADDILEGRAEFQEKSRVNDWDKGTLSLDYNLNADKEEKQPEPDDPEPEI